MKFNIEHGLDTICGMVLLWIITTYSISIILEIPFFSLIIPLLLICKVTLTSMKEFSNKKSQIIFILVLLIKFLFMLYQAKYRNIPMGGNDWEGYNRHATTLLITSENFWQVFYIGDYDLFSRVIAVIYLFLGNHLSLINCFVFATSIGMVKYVRRISEIFIKDLRLSDLIALILMVWPINFIFSITVLREIPIQFALCLSVYCFINYILTTRMKYLLGIVVFSLIAAAFHSGMIGILPVYVLILAVFNVKKRKIDISLIKILISLFGLVIILSSPLGDLMLSKFSSIQSTDDLVEKTSYAAGRTQYVNTTPNNILDIFIQTPYRVIMFALAPLPWQLKGIDTLIAWLIDALPRLFLVYGIFTWIKRFKPKNPQFKIIKVCLILLIFVTYLLCAWGTANYGTAMRHRAKVFPVEVIIMFWSYSLNRGRSRVNYYVEDKFNNAST